MIERIMPGGRLVTPPAAGAAGGATAEAARRQLVAPMILDLLARFIEAPNAALEKHEASGERPLPGRARR
jgi:hypothetical protein